LNDGAGDGTQFEPIWPGQAYQKVPKIASRTANWYSIKNHFTRARY